jgi:hypothetical protein
MLQQQKTDIDKLIDALEEMMDARDDMWQEEKHHNHKHMIAIQDTRYLPAKQNVRWYLQKVVQKIIKENG